MRLNADQNEMIWRVAANVTNEKYWSGLDDTGTYREGDPRSASQ